MARLSSRELSLERRKALTTAGKKASVAVSSGANRVRTASDARPTRTNANAPEALAVAAPPAPVAATQQRSSGRSSGLSAPSRSSQVSVASRSQVKPQRHPGRELVLARREALARRGKSADTSRDRNRSDVARHAKVNAPAAQAEPSNKECGCGGKRTADKATSSARLSANVQLSSRSGERRSSTPKRRAIENSSRSLVLARREAMSKHGKTAGRQPTSAAAVARQANPDLTSRELAQQVRELRTKAGARNKQSAGVTRPTGPNRHGSKEQVAADAHWKVGESQTPAGQTVTGTQANRSLKTTGNEASTCRSITGTEYLGAEVFQTFCQTAPAPTTPPKVRLTATSHGNRVTGNEIGRSEKVTGDEPGTCKLVTGTEYVSANQASTYCGAVQDSPRKVGRSQTLGGQPVSGVMVGRSSRVTGDEPGSGLQLTGDQYLGAEPPVSGRAPTKVASLQTLSGTGVTGTHVGRSQQVTGDEPGSCKVITGDEYIGSQQYAQFCGAIPPAEAEKVGFSITNRSQVVSGTRTGRSDRVTGDEPGTCKAVTGTPYAGLEQAGDYCGNRDVRSIRARTPVRGSNRMSGIQPGIGGVMTGAERGACEDVTGTPYVGADQQQNACAAPISEPDSPSPLDGNQPWQQFSIQSPARVAQLSNESRSSVTGTSYERGQRVTGPFDMAGGKVTGTEQFRFDRRGAQLSRGPITPAAAETDPTTRPVSRVTGEGISAGLKITGDDWDRGDRVTGTEGASARRRNPTRPGPASAMPGSLPKRNEDVPEPVSRVTGSSGNTSAGSLITVSGGARG